ncbi:hypothetical protein BGZ83_007223 [Gryganskiella cystojenkinii]|nr:hypothetical protein BGZ83_007223 [Gryganskiella cystojenkinii]
MASTKDSKGVTSAKDQPNQTHNPATTLTTTSASTSSSSSSYLSALVLGLLSSSCCIIQLVLNVFSIGCAGFSVLTDFRPLFLSISSLLILYTIYKYRFSSRTALTLAITLILTATPEMVAVYNQSNPFANPLLPANLMNSAGSPGSPFTAISIWSRIENWVPIAVKDYWKEMTTTIHMADESVFCAVTPPSSSVQDASASQCGGGGFDSNSRSDPLSAPAGMPSSPQQHQQQPLVKYEIQIDGMACEACANRLRTYFKNQPGLAGASVFFKEKKLVLWTSAGMGSLKLSEKAIQDMVGQVDEKYSAKLLGIFSAGSKHE